jgi:hypothetical protein
VALRSEYNVVRCLPRPATEAGPSVNALDMASFLDPDTQPYQRFDRVVIHLSENDPLFNGRHGSVRRVRWAKPRGKNKQRGWWVTIACDLPPHLQRLECEVASFTLTREAQPEERSAAERLTEPTEKEGPR